MRTLVRFYRVQYLLERIDAYFLEQKVIEEKITIEEMEFITKID
jgi:hypothetical protein